MQYMIVYNTINLAIKNACFARNHLIQNENCYKTPPINITFTNLVAFNSIINAKNRYTCCYQWRSRPLNLLMQLCKCSKCHCNEKIVNPILIVKKQHLQMRLNGVFSFSIPCFVSEIFRFLKHAN